MSVKSYTLLLSTESLKGVLLKLKEAQEANPLTMVGLDMEGTGVNAGKDRMVGFSMAHEGNCWYAPVGHASYPNIDMTPELTKLIGDIKWVCYSSSYERKFALKEWGVELQVVGDGQILSRMLQFRTYNLSETCEKLKLGGKVIQLADLTGGTFDFSRLDPKDRKVITYACDDAWKAVLVECELRKLLVEKAVQGKYPNWAEIYQIELGAQEALAPMESRGVALDMKKIPQIRDAMAKWLDAEAIEIHRMLGSHEYFKLNSPTKLSHQLFVAEEGPKLEGYTRTKSGYSTAMDHLEMLKEQHPVIARLIEWKHQFAVYTRDMSKVEEWTVGGRVYPSFQTLGVDATGRIYATDPSITQFSKELRKLVVPDEGCVFVHWDWRQAEVRVIAAVSEDPTLMRIFASGEDPYKQVAAQVLGKDISDVTKEDRDRAKIVTLAYLYGTKGYSISRRLKIPQEEAAELLEGFNRRFPKVAQWYKASFEKAITRGESHTPMGRRRTVLQELMQTRDRKEKEVLARSNTNFEIQSYCGGELLKMVMLKLHRAMRGIPALRGGYAFCPVFDAVAYQIPKEGLADFKELLQKHATFWFEKSKVDGYMRPSTDSVPEGENVVTMLVDVGVSDESWAAAK